MIVKDGTFGALGRLRAGYIKAGPCRQDKQDLSEAATRRSKIRRTVYTIQVLEVHGKDALYAERRLSTSYTLGLFDRHDKGGCAA